MKKNMTSTYKVAVAGIITALGSVILILSSVIAVGTYALPIIASTLLCILVIDFSKSLAWSCFIATSLLSGIISSDKETVLFYVCFFGYYTIIKANIEKLENKVLTKILKGVIFNSSMIILFLISINFLNIPIENFIIFDINIPILFLLVGNIFFVIYDIALTRIIHIYIKDYRKYIIK